MYTYNDAEKYIEMLSKKGIIPGLDSERNILERINNPQSKYKKIHIAGTNGKGSVSAFISQILICAGYKTGLYNSPAVNDRLEIIKVNNKQITENEYADCIFAVKYADLDNMITAYEAETAAAFLWFEKCGCDVAVIEAGLGGKDDATNVIDDKECAVFASISKDHMNILGNSVAEIAQNKAGIINGTKYVISAAQTKDAENILKNKCLQQNANFICADFYQIKNITFKDSLQTFDYKDLKNIEISLLGKFQTENAAVAIETVCVLRKNGFCIKDEHIYSGLKNAVHKGRFEIIGRKPLFIVDGAHNENAALRLRETVKEYFENRKIYIIMGVFADKDYKSIIALTADIAQAVFAVQPQNERALSKNELAENIAQINKNVYVSDIKDAVVNAVDMAGDDGVIITLGSLSFIRHIKSLYNIIFKGISKNLLM